ncbi:uncharacterized protein [Amphiura filiformis]|uniref:uncharacterized protein n=1 Tax=Amphiura filiformis TaxID=82378 RepID=UPI003B21F809
MALPYLPHEKIAPMFQLLKRRGSTDKLREVFGYIEKTWIEGLWSPRDWSNFMSSVRTNNDVEGWHHRLNQKVGGRANLPFYQLVTELHREAGMVDLQIRLVTEQKLSIHQRTMTKRLQGRLFTYWDEFNQKTRTTERLLRACAAPATESLQSSFRQPPPLSNQLHLDT